MIKKLSIFLICLASCSASREETVKAPITPQEIISFHKGYSFWQEQLRYFKRPYDIEQVINGVLAADKHETLPFNEEDISVLVQKYKEEVFLKTARENLEKAESFLQNIAKDPQVMGLIPSKLYYKVNVKGEGQAVSSTDCPFVTFTVRTADEEIYSPVGELQVSLPDMIQGFAKGVVGMLQGEERTLYIHPELAYGDFSGKLDPNTLVIIDVKVTALLK